MRPAYMYSVVNAAALLAYREFSEKCKEITTTAKAFADQFAAPGQTATPLYYSETKSLAGVKFSPIHTDDVIWTRPSREGAQSPRATPKKLKGVPLTAEQVAEHKRLSELWAAGYPREGADINDVIGAITGVNNRFFLSATLTTVSDTEMLIVMSEPAKNTDGLRELTGSEYTAIKATAIKATAKDE